MGPVRWPAALLVVLLTLQAPASALTLGFDGVGNDITSIYAEKGFLLTIEGGNNPHFGDENPMTGVADWHNGGANADPALVTLARRNGQPFSLVGFDVLSGLLRVGGLGDFAPGRHGVDQHGVTAILLQAVTLYRDDGSRRFNGVIIDNVEVLPGRRLGVVPLPGSSGMLTLGLALLAGLRCIAEQISRQGLKARCAAA